MAQASVRRKVVRALAKGQLTIPSEFREALGIDSETLLDISLVGDHLEITPLPRQADTFRRYSDEDVERFLDEDKLDEETARRVRNLLKHGGL